MANKVDPAHIEQLANSLIYKCERIGETTLTACWSFLPSGFHIGYGVSACVDPNNYNKEIGEQIATERCKAASINKLWELEGYKLFCELNP